MKLSSALLLPAAAVAFVGQAPAQKANVARGAVLARPAAARTRPAFWEEAGLLRGRRQVHGQLDIQ